LGFVEEEKTLWGAISGFFYDFRDKRGAMAFKRHFYPFLQKTPFILFKQ